MTVAGERPLGEELAAAHRAGSLRPADGGAVGRRARPAPRRGRARGRRRPDRPRPGRRRRGRPRAAAARARPPHRGPPRAGRPARRTGRPYPAARAARRTASNRSVSVRRAGDRPEDDGDLAALGPAQRAGPGEHGLVGLGAEHGIDHQGLEPGVPGAAHLGGPGVDLGGGESDLAGVAQDGGVHLGRVGRVDQGVDVALHDLDRQPDQVDGLLQRDHAGQRRGAAPKTEEASGVRRRARGRPAGTSRRSSGCRPARSGPPRSGPRPAARANHGSRCSIRVVAAVLRAPVERRSSVARPARAGVGGGAGRGAAPVQRRRWRHVRAEPGRSNGCTGHPAIRSR